MSTSITEDRFFEPAVMSFMLGGAPCETEPIAGGRGLTSGSFKLWRTLPEDLGDLSESVLFAPFAMPASCLPSFDIDVLSADFSIIDVLSADFSFGDFASSSR